MTQGFLADTCLDVRDTDNGVDVGVKITSTAATATMSMYAATDCGGSAAGTMSMTLNECTADEEGDASSIATYVHVSLPSPFICIHSPLITHWSSDLQLYGLLDCLYNHERLDHCLYPNCLCRCSCHVESLRIRFVDYVSFTLLLVFWTLNTSFSSRIIWAKLFTVLWAFLNLKEKMHLVHKALVTLIAASYSMIWLISINSTTHFLANGACFKTDDAASMKLTYTATGCTMENFDALECPSANSQGELEIVTGVCVDDSQTIDYITGQITCAKQVLVSQCSMSVCSR